ncbi:RidA family protein (plasmid) [Rhizobium sp. CB3171]|uniref:RidA family protein n=1 Tax=Rhizobium jaguaris TaxID=1312183 RepID=A0A387G480_9HYPH|nr:MULTISPECIES: RidA family protein [Rhizobium]AYG64165.1 RidA family protein [Rhizobium jaguaris]WFU06770.1 RidA family protein [Rhizobium sp. CB3171]
MKRTGHFNTPIANGNYLIAKRHRDLVFTSGMTPRSKGVIVHVGTVDSEDAIDDYKDAVELAASNALAAARTVLTEGEQIAGVLTLTVFIAANPGFKKHSQIADFASDHLLEEIGPGAIGTRAAVGVTSLPGGAVVEIQMTAVIGN